MTPGLVSLTSKLPPSPKFLDANLCGPLTLTTLCLHGVVVGPPDRAADLDPDGVGLDRDVAVGDLHEPALHRRGLGWRGELGCGVDLDRRAAAGRGGLRCARARARACARAAAGGGLVRRSAARGEQQRHASAGGGDAGSHPRRSSLDGCCGSDDEGDDRTRARPPSPVVPDLRHQRLHWPTR